MKPGTFARFAVLGLSVVDSARPAELRDTTLDLWQEYVRDAGVRMKARLKSDRPFLWIDEQADRKARVRRGEVVVAPAYDHATKNVPNGLIHDWAGAVFIPNATIDNVKDILHDYDRYDEIYRPVVTRSQAITSQEFSMTWQRHILGVNAAMQAQYRVQDFAVDAHTGYSLVEATRIQEIEEYGRPSERLLDANRGSGFIWRVYSIVRYKQSDGGVYLEIEAMVLSRDIPLSLRWMLSGVVNRLSISSLSTTLNQTRAAVDSQIAGEARLRTSDRAAH